MKRRTLLGSLGAGAAVGGTAFATGAFTSVEATRTARVDVVGDDAALLAMEAADGPNGAYAEQGDDGELGLDFTGTDTGDGLGPNSRYVFDDVFVVTNQGTQSVTLTTAVDGVEDASGVESFDLYDSESGEALDESGVELGVGETVSVGVEIRTGGRSDETGVLDVTLQAGDAVGAPSEGPEARSATITDEMHRTHGVVGPGLGVEVTAQAAPGDRPIEAVTVDATAFGVDEPVELEPDEEADGEFAGGFRVGDIDVSPGDEARVTVTVRDDAGLEDTVTSNVLELIEDPSARWIERAFWQSPGYATEFPGQVVYPSDSERVVDVLRTFDRGDDVDEVGIARAAADLQNPYVGGFEAFWGGVMGPWVSATHGAVVLAKRHDVDVYEEGAAYFLKQMQRPNGGFSPRVGLNGSLISARMEATALALDALERLDALDERTRSDAVEFLVDHQREDGGWPTHVPASESTVEGTFFALRALDRLGEIERIDRTRAGVYLLGLQTPDGGFRSGTDPTACPPSRNPWPTNCEVDPQVTVRSTARAILAIQVTGVPEEGDDLLREAHAEFLTGLQLSDPEDTRHAGAFETYAARDAPVVDYRTNTRLAVPALEAIGADFDPESALDFLVRCQHDGSEGFGMEPGYVGSVKYTAPAVRALEVRDLLDAVPAGELASRMAFQQADDGAILDLGMDEPGGGVDTARSLSVLARLGRTDAVDVAAAVDHVAGAQRDDGGFGSTSYSVSSETAHVVRGLDAVGELDAIDGSGVGTFFAGVQNDDGSITDQNADYEKARDTRFALDALDRLGRTDAVDVSSALSYLESEAEADGTEGKPYRISHAIVGLDVLDELEGASVDLAESEAALRDYLLPTGGYAARIFYRDGGTAMERQAAFLDALAVLEGARGQSGYEPATTTTDGSSTASASGRESQSASSDDEVPERAPVRLEDAGWVERPPEDARP